MFSSSHSMHRAGVALKLPGTERKFIRVHSCDAWMPIIDLIILTEAADILRGIENHSHRAHNITTIVRQITSEQVLHELYTCSNVEAGI